MLLLSDSWLLFWFAYLLAGRKSILVCRVQPGIVYMPVRFPMMRARIRTVARKSLIGVIYVCTGGA